MKLSNRTALFAVLCLLFVLLATANSGGYRYGIGDQAFYEPASQLRLQPALFPRDRVLLESQAKLTVVDEVLAGASTVTGLQLPSLFLLLYLVSLVTLCVAAESFARVLGLSAWATAVFFVLLTLRHRIAKTGANTLEGYMHPRQLAFAAGVLALSCSLKNRWWLTLCFLVFASAIHPTTATWFVVLIAGGLIIEEIVLERGSRFVALLAIVVLIAAWAASRLVLRLPTELVMDNAWTSVFADKDYIFVSTWPTYAWALNLMYLPLMWISHRGRKAAGVAHPLEGRVVAGGGALLILFFASIFFSESRVALAVQLQVSRVFWIMDFVLMAYVAWWLTSSPAVRRIGGVWAPRIALSLVAAFSIGRGLYTLHEAGPDRSLFRVSLPSDDWSRTMAWLRTQPSDWQVLTDPDHAWKFGSSVRVAASRDVVLESVKDNSISLYDRATAMRVAERTQALANFSSMSAEQARAIGKRFDAAVLVTETHQVLALPKLYSNGGFTVYDLR